MVNIKHVSNYELCEYNEWKGGNIKWKELQFFLGDRIFKGKGSGMEKGNMFQYQIQIQRYFFDPPSTKIWNELERN